MRFRRYITEKKVQLTGDQWKDKFIKKLNQWDSDVSRMTKYYNSLKADESDSALREFLKAKKAFLTFANNFEKFVYQELLDNSPSAVKKETYIQSEVRKHAWTFIGDIRIYELFPEAYDYKTEKHVPAPWELDRTGYGQRNRKQVISKYQRSWRLFKKAAEEYIQYQSESIQDIRNEQIQIAGITILIKNRNIKQYDDKWIKRFLKHLPKAVQAIKKAGLGSSLEGLSVEMNFNPTDVSGVTPGGLTAGGYSKETDKLYIFPLGMTDNVDESTLVHEIGHRYWFRKVPNGAQKAWAEKIDSRMITVTKEHIDKFFDMFWDNQWGFPYRREFKDKIDKITDPTLKVVFGYLSKHTPLYDVKEGDKKTVYKEHMIKHEKGEQVPLEWISDYGRTNAAEAFADTFRIWVSGKIQKLGEWTRAFFKEIVRTGGASLKEDIIDKYLIESKLRLKRVGPGEYEAKIGNITIDVYNTHKGYWSSTVEVGKYGDSNWQEQVIQGETKAEVVQYIENFIKKVK